MRRSLCILVCVGWGGWLGVAATLAQVPGATSAGHLGKPGRASIFSADHRFMVGGMTSAENMVLAESLATLARQVEEKVGQPLPMTRDQVLGVMVQSLSSPNKEILKVQGWDDGQFYQRLVVPGALRIDGEDLLEGACWLLLNRYAAEWTPLSRRTGMGAVMPDWISAGLTQNTQAALRSRNREWLAREWAEGRRLPLAQVIKQELLPPGRWREKAYAAAAVEFLFGDGDTATWTALFQAVGGKQVIDGVWLRNHCPALQDRKPEAAWFLFLSQRATQQTVATWSDRGMQIESQLLQMLHFRPHDMVAGVPSDVPVELFARDLIDYRDQPWVPTLASALSLRIQSLKLGATRVLQDVIASYAAYLDQLVTPPAAKTSWWNKGRKDPRKIQPPDDATWQLALNQLWLRAERQHQAFLESNQARKRYVDSFDAAPPGVFDEPAPAAADVPRTRVQKYVDSIEEKLAAP